MTKNSILLLLAVITASASAQTTGFITGRASVTSMSSPNVDGSTTSGTFGPAVGYNINDRFVVGLGLEYSGTTVSTEASIGGTTQDIENRNTLFTITPFARYMKKVNEDLSMYAQLAVGIGTGKNTQEQLTMNGNGNVVVEETETGRSTFRAAFGPGLMYKLAPRWALSADWGALSYESQTYKPETGDDHTTNTFGLALTPAAIMFGLNWLF